MQTAEHELNQEEDTSEEFVTEKFMINVLANEREKMNKRHEEQRIAIQKQLLQFQEMTMMATIQGVDAAMNAKLQNQMVITNKTNTMKYALSFGISILGSLIGAYAGRVLYNKFSNKT